MMRVNERHRPKSKLSSNIKGLQKMCDADSLKWRDDRFWSHMSKKPHSHYERLLKLWDLEHADTVILGCLIHLSMCSLTGEVDNLPHTHAKPTDSDTGWICFRVWLEGLVLCPAPAGTGLKVGPPYTTFTVFPLLRVHLPFLALLSIILLSIFHLLFSLLK